MRFTTVETPSTTAPGSARTSTADQLCAYFSGLRNLRKGVCLLNAGQFELAALAFTRASSACPAGSDLADQLVSALVAAGRYDEAAEATARTAAARPDDLDEVIRLALLEWKAGRSDDAIRTLREALAEHAEHAELHFQLGTMLAAADQPEEAELRFTQAVAIDKEHAGALINLAMCCGVRRDSAGAVSYLQRAQQRRPADARVGLLLATAAKAAQDDGRFVSIRAEMPTAVERLAGDARGPLAAAIERDPEFVEAFLALDSAEFDREILGFLADTLQLVVERSPHRAVLHFYLAKVLERLNRIGAAISAAERSIELDARAVPTLILLAELYRQSARPRDAAAKLRQSLHLGAEYADTYFLLGNLYRETGETEQARWAYRKALELNGRYEAAKQALASLAA